MEKAWHILFANIALMTVRYTFALGVLLSACGADPESPHSFTAKPLASVPQIPSTQQLRIPLPPGTFTTLDFMTLHGCALQITLGKYQSKLGQFASDSQRLLLDLEYLHLAPDCIALKQSEHELALAEQLLQENKLKLQQLPSRIFNATLANTEFQQFWNKHYMCCDNAGQFQLTLSAIADITGSAQRWLRGNYQASNIEFEIQLSEIAKGNAAYIQSETLRQTLAKFETQLRPILPLGYQRWRELRHIYVQDFYHEQR